MRVTFILLEAIYANATHYKDGGNQAEEVDTRWLRLWVFSISCVHSSNCFASNANCLGLPVFSSSQFVNQSFALDRATSVLGEFANVNEQLGAPMSWCDKAKPLVITPSA